MKSFHHQFWFEILHSQTQKQFFYFNSEQASVGKHMRHSFSYMQKQSTKWVFQERCAKKISTVYRRTSMQKRDFNLIEITLLHWYSSVNMLHICSRMPYLEITYGELLLCIVLNIEVLSKQVKNRLKCISIL